MTQWVLLAAFCLLLQAADSVQDGEREANSASVVACVCVCVCVCVYVSECVCVCVRVLRSCDTHTHTNTQTVESMRGSVHSSASLRLISPLPGEWKHVRA